jgi:16S rRNA methyltransferase RsmB/F
MVDAETTSTDVNPDGDHHRPTVRPIIYSLKEYEVVITDEVQLSLAGAYEPQFVDDLTNPVGDNSKSEADKHLKKVLDAMKSAPETTICRVHSMGKHSSTDIINTIIDIKQELHSYLSKWLSTRTESDSFRITLDDHPLFEDVLRISVSKESDDFVSVYSQRIPEVPTLKEPNPQYEKPFVRLFENWPSREEQGWPMTHRAILCDRFCGEAVLRGSDIFVCGIIAADSGIQANEIVAVYADCTNYNAIMTNTTESGAKEASQSSKTPLPSRGMILNQFSGQCIYLGLGKSVCKRSSYFSKNNGLGIEMLPQCRSLRNNNTILPPLSGALPNTVFLQNEPSILVGTLLQPFHDNQRILDMCSAPGGKALHVSNLTQNLSNVVIVSCDVSRKKMVAAKRLFDRYGATNIVPIALDSTRCCLHTERSESLLTHRSLNEVSHSKGLIIRFQNIPILTIFVS